MISRLRENLSGRNRKDVLDRFARHIGELTPLQIELFEHLRRRDRYLRIQQLMWEMRPLSRSQIVNEYAKLYRVLYPEYNEVQRDQPTRTASRAVRRFKRLAGERWCGNVGDTLLQHPELEDVFVELGR